MAEKNLHKSSDLTGRKKCVDFSKLRLAIGRQADLLRINRSSVYRDPPKEKTISDEDLFIMCRIDEIHTAHPTWGPQSILNMAAQMVEQSSRLSRR